MELGHFFVLICHLSFVWSVAAGPLGEDSSLLVQVLVKSSHFTDTDNLATEGPAETTEGPAETTERPAASYDENYTLTLHHGISSIWAEWQKSLPDEPSRATKFVLTWNGRTIPLNGTTFEYRLKDVALCSDYLSPALSTVTLAAFDDYDTFVMVPVTERLEMIMRPFPIRNVLRSGTCFYYDTGEFLTYNESLTACRDSLHGTMFSANEEGDIVTFLSDLEHLVNSGDFFGLKFHVGLRKTAGEWRWLNGLLQSETAVYVSQNFDPQDGRDEAAISEVPRPLHEPSVYKLSIYEQCVDCALGCLEYFP